MIVLEPWRQVKNISFNRAVFKKKPTENQNVLGAHSSIDSDHHNDTISRAHAGSQLVKSHAVAVIFLSGLLLGSTSGVGGIRKCVQHAEANRNPLSSEEMPGEV